MSELNFCINVVINKEKTKVLFAEAGGHFVDVLLSLLLLPLSTIMEVLEKHYGYEVPVIGSLTTLYSTAAYLHIDHFHGDYAKKKLINSSTRCEKELQSLRLNYGTQPYNGVFSDGVSSFIITDDLCVLPIEERSIVETLCTLGIAMEDMDYMETRDVWFGLNEIIGLLKESLICSNPLTALIFPGRQMVLATDVHVLSHQIDVEKSPYLVIPENNILKVLLQKSTNKLLFAQANSCFVDFLFSIMGMSLERFDLCMGSNTGLKNIASLHRSKASNFKKMLSKQYRDLLLRYNHTALSSVKGYRMYMVRDDLTVSPLEVTSGVSLIKELKISLSDVKEVKLQIGVEECLSILKAALTSTTALTYGLIKPFLSKQEMDIKPFLKQEME